MKKNSLLNLLIFSVFFGINIVLSAQKSEVIDFDTQDVYTQSLHVKLFIKLNQNKLLIEEKTEKVDVYQTGENINDANESIGYNSFNTISELKASTTNQIGNRTQTYSVEKFEEKDIIMSSVFYSDQKLKNFAFKNVSKGASTHLNYTINISDPHFIPAFSPMADKPIMEAVYSITFPKEVIVQFKTFNLNETVIFSEEINGNLTTYTWAFKNIPKRSRYYDFSSLYYIPQIFVRINSYLANGQTIRVSEDVSDLYAWYQDLIQNINQTDQTELEKITKNLIQNKNSEIEKIEAIYYYVQNRIHYIAFEDALNGFVPRDAMNVHNNTYGDCKDMANLLNEMLQYAGIKSYLTWIGTRSKPYNYNDLPTVHTDNHMITAVYWNNQYYFLDPTYKYLKFGLPSIEIQNKQALIGLSEHDYILKDVPVVSANQNQEIIHSQFEITNNDLYGSHDITLTGFKKLLYKLKFDHKEDTELDFYSKFFEFGTKKTSFNDINSSQMDTHLDSMNIQFKTISSDYCKKIGNKLYLKLNFDHNLSEDLLVDEYMNFDKKINFKYEKNHTYLLKIPAQAQLDFIPENATFDNEYFSFSITYTLTPEGLLLKKNITVNTLKIEVDRIAKWNEFVEAYTTQINKMTVLIYP